MTLNKIIMRRVTDYYTSVWTLLISIVLATSCNNSKEEKSASVSTNSATAEIALPTGFAATIVADSLGAIRHLAVNKNGNIYVKLGALKDGKGIYYLTDTDHNGTLDKCTGFGNYPGTGIHIKGN